ncbi:cob(I)yrinic acid a,c-diamide adenosyltransferase [Eubacterium sp. AF17-7]|uniref:cob(I)yrinic acid a,c-diamide adenosyltransferase n=1 Tax=Eubacterium sp. AF17-7 TaxID=2293105 RepID=UPI001314DF72|nr:cob(I)yrinic acid a,c-diamide adenosyltransferase [Eubacterium sp. AF17-7]
MLHIKCGDGVGKTTSAVGQAVRMLGYNKKVIFVQFMKDGLSGEINFLKNNSNIYVLHPTGPIKFIWNMTASEKSDLKDIHTNLIKETEKILKSDNISMVIFDEFNSANELNLLDKDYAYKLICEYKDKTEIILTGRNPEEKYVEISDYISEINCIKHPFESGVNARKGIEY